MKIIFNKDKEAIEDALLHINDLFIRVQTEIPEEETERCCFEFFNTVCGLMTALDGERGMLMYCTHEYTPEEAEDATADKML